MKALYILLRNTIVAILIGSSLIFSSQVWSANYNEAIKEGQEAAQQLINQHGVSALTIALVDKTHIIWSQTFGIADPKTGQLPKESTMFGIGSVSKLFAAMAVMKLVDQGVIDLDTPLIAYLPSFKMASPEYKNITVRMLLNHSAGFPGTDDRNAMIRTPMPKSEYENQVLQTLSNSRLKAPPGYMSVYCNDCFTMIEPLIEKISGKSYAQFVQDEIFTPLDMKNTTFPTHPLPDGSYAKALKQDQVKPQEYVNAFASGGIYSTANDMARAAMMLLNNGTLGSTRILSKEAISQMAEDQTASKFNPIHSNTWAYGLGWDSVLEPGLLSVGFDGWNKGGDSYDYHSTIIVSPKAGLGIIVIGASDFSSDTAKALGERILLRALAENGKIPKFPLPLTANPSSEELPASNELPSSSISGIFASSGVIFNVAIRPDNILDISTLTDKGWKKFGESLSYLNNGWYANNKNPLTSFKVINANLMGKPTPYLVVRAPFGYKNYLDYLVLAQKVVQKPHNLSATWLARLPLTWLVVNPNPSELTWEKMDPRLSLMAIPDLQGLIAIRAPNPEDPSQLQVLDPSTSDMQATMMLTIPQLLGRDLNDLVIVKRNDKEWVRFGSYIHQPLGSVTKLVYGKTQTITIDPEGYAEWRALSYRKNNIEMTIKTTGVWILYDTSFKKLGEGTGDGTVVLPAGKGLGYLMLFGKKGQIITVSTHEKT